MKINEWAKEIHRNAVEHGFWDETRSFAEIVALCHSELSEALQADRQDMPPYFKTPFGNPEGTAVEMIDCMIRILDYLGSLDIDVERVLAEKHIYNTHRPYLHGKKY